MINSETMPEIPQAMKSFVNATPEVQSLLYDLDLLPEQLMSQDEITDGLKRAYIRFFLIVGHFMAFKDRLIPDPATTAAMDETLAYFDEEFPDDMSGKKVDALFVSDRSGGLTIDMLRTLRGMWK